MTKLISIGQIIDQTWHHYTKHFVALMSVTVWLLVIAVLNIITSSAYPELASQGAQSTFTAVETSKVALYFFTWVIVGPILSVWIFNTLIKLVHGQVKGTDISKVAKEGWRYFWPRILVGLEVAILIALTFFATLPGMLITYLAGILESNMISIIGMLFILVGITVTIVLSIFLLVNFVFSSYALLIEDKRGRSALRRSLELVKGRWWPVLWRILFPKTLFFFAFFAIQGVLLFFLKILAVNIAGLNILFAGQIYSLGSIIIFVILTALINPLILIADYLVFENLRK